MPDYFLPVKLSKYCRASPASINWERLLQSVKSGENCVQYWCWLQNHFLRSICIIMWSNWSTDFLIVIFCGGNGIRTHVLQILYMKFITCFWAWLDFAEQNSTGFHHLVLRKPRKQDNFTLQYYVPSSLENEDSISASSSDGSSSTKDRNYLARMIFLSFYCFAISRHDCLHDFISFLYNQFQNTPD